MTILGMTIAEFVAVLGSVIAIIITVSKAGKVDVPSESIRTLLDPLNHEIEELRATIEALNKANETMKASNKTWKQQTSRKISRIISDLDNLKHDLEKSD